MECRINAEDPFRGFLPSTGRLVQFQPPAQQMEAALPMPQFAAGANDGTAGGVRVDTGVAGGGEIPMHYDSMIAKLIVHGSSRADAIARMREALNAFVIRGVSSNIPFQAALLAHPKFQSGDFNTGFIAEHYAHGFRAEDVAHADVDFLVALAAVAYRHYRERAAGISGQLAGHHVVIGSAFVAVVKGQGGQHRHVPLTIHPVGGGSIVVAIGDKRYDISGDWHFGAARIAGLCNGQPFTAQFERQGMWYGVLHDGTRIDAQVLSARAAELLRVMPFKAPADMSKFLLSPMPGLLVSLAVQPGQKVQAGERLAVIEAMKMENILTAAADGTVNELLAQQGESLSVDQPILSFA
jgi:propionyl-CoA carboxylase alpha chain